MIYSRDRQELGRQREMESSEHCIWAPATVELQYTMLYSKYHDY